MRATWPLLGSNGPYSRVPLAAFLEAEVRLGLDGVDFVPQTPHFWCSHTGHESAAPLRAALAEAGLPVRVLTPPPYRYSLTAPPGRQREATLYYYRVCIALAAELGADRVVVNSGWGYQGEDESAMWNRCRDHLGRLCQVAQPCGVTLVMESLRDDESNLVCNLERARRMHREVGHPSLKMMVDNIATGAAGETLGDWFRAFGAELIHMHFLDGDPWLHNVWGDGNTALAQQIQTMNDHHYTGYLVQEVADEHYFSDPYAADRRNLRVLERFVEDD